uniref:Nonstructural polyprotein n=1 Tax=tick alphatetravirus 1 TaxID=3078973 RepID=A0AA87CJA2_9VIRU|nr:TPA_asm: nonstructural polyprotein [tick alphatetravirus 1]
MPDVAKYARDSGQDALAVAAAREQVEVANRLFQNLYRLRYRLTAEEVKWFEAAFPDMPFSNGAKWGHPHAAAGELRFVMRKLLNEKINNAPYVSFGGKADIDLLYSHTGEQFNCLHLCSKDSARDTYRYATAAATFRRRMADRIETDIRIRKITENLEAAVAHTPLPHPTDIMCFEGGENCFVRVPAQFMIALDATYDVSPQDFVRSMINKDIGIAHVAMMFPPGLVTDADFSDTVFRYRRITRGGRVMLVQGFRGETSEPYIHYADTWLSWLTTQVVRAPQGNYAFAVAKRHGLYRMITIHKTHNPVPPPLTVPFDFGGNVLIPKFSYILRAALARKNCTDEFARYCLQKVPQIVIPRTLLMRMIEYITSRNGEVDYETVHSYYRSQCQALSFAGTQIQNKWDAGLPEDEFLSVYFAGIVQRYMVTDGVKHGFAEVKWSQKHGTFIDEKDVTAVLPSRKYGQGSNELWPTIKAHFSHFFHRFKLSETLEHDVSCIIANNIGAMAMRPTFEMDLPGQVLSLQYESPLPSSPTQEYKIIAARGGSEIDAALRDYTSDYLLTLPSHDERFQHLAERIAEAAAGVHVSLDYSKVRVHLGPPGAGKTTELLSTLEGSVLYVGASKSLADAVTSDAPAHWECETQHVALLRARAKKFDHIIVDEFAVYHAGYIQLFMSFAPQSNILLLGDMNQCTYHDEDHPEQEKNGAAVLLPAIEKLRTQNNYRSPKAVARWLRSIPNYDVVHKSTVEGYCGVSADQDKLLRHKVLITLSRKLKDDISALVSAHKAKAKVYTAREAQGETFPDVGIVLDHVPDTPVAQKMFYVALTRSNEKVVVYINRATNSAELNIFNNRLDVALATWTGFVPYNTECDEPTAPILRLEKPDCVEFPRAWSEADVEAALDTAYGRPNVPDNVLGLAPTNLAWKLDKYCKVDPSRGIARDTPLTGRVFRGSKHVKAFHAKNNMQVLSTIGARQGAKVGSPPAAAASTIDRFVDDVVAAFEKRYIKRTTTGPAWKALDEAQLTRSLLGYLAKCEELGTTLKLEEFDVTNIDHTKVTAELKRIYKVVPTGPESDKPGQVISAWSKPLNVLFAICMRSAEECLEQSLNGYTHYANRMTEKQLADFYEMACKADNSDNDTTRELNMDFSQFDASQSSVTIRIERAIMRKLGFEGPLLDFYFRIRSAWTALCPGFVAIDAESMKSSGEPATLFLNTVLNMAYCAYVTDTSNIRFQAFKGDDSCIKGPQVVINEARRSILELITRVTIKTEYSVGSCSHFCGAFYSPYGYFLDYYRTAAKIRGVVFRDAEHFAEFQQAVNDRHSTSLKTPPDYIVRATSAYYKSDKRVGHEVTTSVLAFCAWFTRATWDEFLGFALQYDGQYCGGMIVCVDAFYEVKTLAPWDAQAIQDAYENYMDSTRLCRNCPVDQYSLDLRCKQRHGNRCLVCRRGCDAHLCYQCARTYRPAGLGACSECTRGAIFCDTRRLCLAHFKGRYERKERVSNDYRVGSGDSSSSQRSRVPQRKVAAVAIKKVKEWLAPRREDEHPLLPLASLSVTTECETVSISTQTDAIPEQPPEPAKPPDPPATAGDQQPQSAPSNASSLSRKSRRRRKKIADDQIVKDVVNALVDQCATIDDYALECSRTAVKNQLGPAAAALFWAEVLKLRRRDKDQNPYVSIEHCKEAFTNLEIPYVIGTSGVPDPSRPPVDDDTLDIIFSSDDARAVRPCVLQFVGPDERGHFVEKPRYTHVRWPGSSIKEQPPDWSGACHPS